MKLEIKISGDFLRAENISEGDIATILNEGEIRKATFGGDKEKTVFELAVEIKQQKYSWTVNKTALKKLVELLSDETKSWVGKRVKLGKVKVNVRGQTKDSIVVLEVFKGSVIEGKPVEVVKI